MRSDPRHVRRTAHCRFVRLKSLNVAAVDDSLELRRFTSIPRRVCLQGGQAERYNMSITTPSIPVIIRLTSNTKQIYLLNWGKQRCHLLTEPESRKTSIPVNSPLLAKKPGPDHFLAVGPATQLMWKISLQPST